MGAGVDGDAGWNLAGRQRYRCEALQAQHWLWATCGGSSGENRDGQRDEPNREVAHRTCGGTHWLLGGHQKGKETAILCRPPVRPTQELAVTETRAVLWPLWSRLPRLQCGKNTTYTTTHTAISWAGNYCIDLAIVIHHSTRTRWCRYSEFLVNRMPGQRVSLNVVVRDEIFGCLLDVLF